MKKWIKEIARDLQALGSIPFYIIVLIRAHLDKNYAFIYNMIIAAIALLVLYFIVKDSNMYVARALVVAVFASLFYKDALFAAFALILWILLVISAFYINKKIGNAIRGIIVGILSSLIGFYGIKLFLTKPL